ncbi:hypothetical protein D1643_02450 [Enterorhabdus sp. P55]|nr:hypothetical protein [Enterorhabdus sp. P55]
MSASTTVQAAVPSASKATPMSSRPSPLQSASMPTAATATAGAAPAPRASWLADPITARPMQLTASIQAA